MNPILNNDLVSTDIPPPVIHAFRFLAESGLNREYGIGCGKTADEPVTGSVLYVPYRCSSKMLVSGAEWTYIYLAALKPGQPDDYPATGKWVPSQLCHVAKINQIPNFVKVQAGVRTF